MKLLAVHTMGHDAGACLFDGGRLEFAIESERLTRVKHEGDAHVALDHLFAATGVAPGDVDFVAFSTNVRNRIARIRDFERVRAAIESPSVAVAATCDLLGREVPCLVVAHEASHAAAACHAGGWPDPALVLVNEGRGTFSRNSLFAHRDGRLDLLEWDALPWYGTGFGWSALGYLLGFGDRPSAAGTVMALGGYAPGVSDEATAVVERIDPAVHHGPRPEQRRQLAPLLDYLERHQGFDERAALVRALQDAFVGAVTGYVGGKLAEVGAGHVGLGGGCALNLPANTAVRSDVCPRVAIAPNCSDAGQALGAALYALRFHHGIQPEPFGPDRNGAPLDAAATAAAATAAGFSLAAYDPDAVLDRLAAGEAVGWCRGRAELGPRALGHRSVLASTAVPGTRRQVSEGIKGRQWFRPLAFVMREERFAEAFPGAALSPYMLFNYDVPAGLAPEGTHADGTSRIQTLARPTNPALHDLLAAHEERTGEVGLINTSLNGPGRPIAHTAADALGDLAGRGVDLFVFDDVMAVRG